MNKQYRNTLGEWKYYRHEYMLMIHTLTPPRLEPNTSHELRNNNVSM